MKPGRFELKVGPRPGKRWSWADFIRLPISKVTRDFPCITKWSKFDAAWEGVTVDELLADAAAHRFFPRDFFAISKEDYAVDFGIGIWKVLVA